MNYRDRDNQKYVSKEFKEKFLAGHWKTRGENNQHDLFCVWADCKLSKENQLFRLAFHQER